MKEEFIFKEGDLVRMGEGENFIQGRLEKNDDDSYKVKIRIGVSFILSFTDKGSLYLGSVPVLILIERPKTMVKKWRWVYNNGSDFIISNISHTEQDAESFFGLNSIQKIDASEKEFEE